MKSTVRCRVGFSLLCGLVWFLPAAALSADSADAGTGQAALRVDFDGTQRQLSLDGRTAFHTTSHEVRSARVVAVPDSPTLLALWEESSAGAPSIPHYAISRDGQRVDRVRRTSCLLKLRHGDFDPAAGVRAVEAGLQADASCNLHIVQFVTQPLVVFRTQMEALGANLRQFIANHAYIVEMSPTVRDTVAALPYVRWVGAYHPAYRLETYLRENRARAAELFPEQRYNIAVFEPGLSQKRAVASRILARGGVINQEDAGKYLLEATLSPELLFQVIRWNEVHFVGRWEPYVMDMNLVREFGGANYIATVAGYTGAGVRGEAFDGGCQIAHQEFDAHPLILHGDVYVQSHGTATAGICFASGVDPQARGLLPDGQGIVGDATVIGAHGLNRYIHTGELLEAPYYGVFETASVSSGFTTAYTAISQDTDAALFDFDVVHCQSQGNNGSQLSGPQAWAKNIISGGGISHYGTIDPSDDCWCDYASIGPAEDGRIKPDLCAYNDETYTCYSSSPTGYGQFGGTSGATPIIAGHVGLFFQMWADGIFGNEVDPAGTVFENRAHMTTAKAMVINTAMQYPFLGTDHDLTRTHQGWGWPSVTRMYDLRDKMFIIDESVLLENLESISYMLAVEPDEPEFKATLTWADPPGSPSASQARINDLTLKVTAPSGDIYWGNYDLLQAMYSTPSSFPPPIDTINTVENVFVSNPEPGIWTVVVSADEVNEDGHVETPELDVDFALVVSGAVLTAPLFIDLPDGTPDRVDPGVPTPIVVQVEDCLEAVVPGSPTLHYCYDGGTFLTAPLMPLGDDLYEATLPPAACADVPEFYFSATGDGGSTVYNPADAPDETYTAFVATLTILLDDDFETDLGWTVESIDLSDGAWERGVPADDGTSGDPTQDYDGSGQCYLTANRAGSSDVDGGPTHLTSSTLNLSNAIDVTLGYARWISCNDAFGVGADYLVVEVSHDGGDSWLLIESVTDYASSEEFPGWVANEINLTDLMVPTADVLVRFTVSDNPNDSITEAGVDAVWVYYLHCSDDVPGDLNCDGSVDFFDIEPFVLAITDPAGYEVAYPDCDIMLADCNGDGSVDFFDIEPFVELVTGG